MRKASYFFNTEITEKKGVARRRKKVKVKEKKVKSQKFYQLMPLSSLRANCFMRKASYFFNTGITEKKRVARRRKKVKEKKVKSKKFYQPIPLLSLRLLCALCG
jgi:C4-dicarboxylate transporter